MSDSEYFRDDLKQGLPPRDRNADVPEHANGGTIWMIGIIAACAIAALLMFGNSSHRYDGASTSFNAAPGLTKGVVPANE